MEPAKYDFKLIRGNTLQPLQLTVSSGDNTALDLTGATGCWEIKYRPGDEEPVVHALVVTVTDAPAGKIRVDFTGLDIPAGTYVHELTLIFPEGKVTVIRGTAKIEERISSC